MKKINVIKIILSCMSICICAVLTGCSIEVQRQESEPENSIVIREAIDKADPNGAIRAIYASLESHETEKLDSEGLTKFYGIDPGDVLEFHAYRSDPREGLCDIMIVKPITYSEDKVRACLYGYQSERIKEFEDYNILFSYEIAQGAVVYDQGDYIIMLMFEDNEAVRSIIDEYIPQ